MAIVRIGTRGSRLALLQTRLVTDLIGSRFPDLALEVVRIKSRGDEHPQATIEPSAGPGFFTGSLQAALLEERIDLAVHSLKDLPVGEPEGLVLVATPLRDDPLDALVAREGWTLESAPGGATVGTSSPRRAAQVRLVRPDLEIVPVRGNVETRVRKLDAGEFDALVLAAAGLARLGLSGRVTQRLEPPAFLPAPGQGAIAVEGRLRDGRALEIGAAIDDPQVRAAATAERAFLQALGGGCAAVAGALASPRGAALRLTGGVYLDAARTLSVVGSMGEPERLAAEAADRLQREAPFEL